MCVFDFQPHVKPSLVAQVCNPVLRMWRQKIRRSRSSSTLVVSLSPVWLHEMLGKKAPSMKLSKGRNQAWGRAGAGLGWGWGSHVSAGQVQHMAS